MLQDRRKKVMDSPTELEARLNLLDYIDEGDASIGRECKQRFQDVLNELKDGQVTQAIAIREVTTLTKSALLKIDVLADSIAVTREIESAGKKSVGFIKALGNKLGELSEFVKKSFLGIAALFFMYSMLSGNISMRDISGAFVKMMGM